MRKTALFALSLSLFAATACGQGQAGRDAHISHAPNGDLREVTASAETLPSFLDGHSDAVQLAYRVAGTLDDTLEWIPCYCGCGGSAGHRSSLNCFVSEIREDGSVEWDDHGTRCNVCVQIAVESAQMKQQGKTNLEIREQIDEKYRSGYADPTDTPLPTA
ncbi:PCYCGC motif-containing (lipo)protein [Paenibacillaceae bacterium WGS1546]|uniref:PCYCGC motif-containing (lipo)protein n=1 Tax=Cohnella sp. WGS1546 TaxID=3366810 RepID=UPI00372D2B0F